MIISRVQIKNFRSISDLTLHPANGSPVVVTGSNNVGKTNLLRALDLFFSLDPSKYMPEVDIPYHIAEGSGGSGRKSEITVDFIDSTDGSTKSISATFQKAEPGNSLTIKGTSKLGSKRAEKLSEKECRDIVEQYRFILIESNNVDIPAVIANIFETEVLLGLDRMRARQTVPLTHLESFFTASQKSLVDIEKGVTRHLQDLAGDVESLGAKQWKIKVIFPEFERLREAISRLVSYTVQDSNDREIETKGSGIQRLMLLALIKYISDATADRKIIWGIDEPEVFLQPSLQRKVSSELQKMAADWTIFVTTHSQHFINLGKLHNTFLLESKQELKEYVRRPGKHYIKLDTYVCPELGYKKVEKIKRHIGIGRNDGWQVLPYNLLVEGEEDKRYIVAICNAFNIAVPNILTANGASNYGSYLSIVNEFSRDTGQGFRPFVLCILDHDESGKRAFNSIKNNTYTHLDMEAVYISRFDGVSNNKWEFEIEDFVYPDAIFDAVNRVLKSRGYKQLLAADRRKRSLPAYENINILKFVTDISRNSNQQKTPIDFEKAYKKVVCEYVEDALSSSGDLATLDAAHPSVRAFVQMISSKG